MLATALLQARLEMSRVTRKELLACLSSQRESDGAGGARTPCSRATALLLLQPSVTPRTLHMRSMLIQERLHVTIENLDNLLEVAAWEHAGRPRAHRTALRHVSPPLLRDHRGARPLLASRCGLRGAPILIKENATVTARHVQLLRELMWNLELRHTQRNTIERGRVHAAIAARCRRPLHQTLYFRSRFRSQ